MTKIIIYSKVPCPYCVNAKNLLDSLNLKFQEIDLTHNPEELMALVQKTNHRTVPQIFINDKFIGGYDSLLKLHQEGGLKGL